MRLQAEENTSTKLGLFYKMSDDISQNIFYNSSNMGRFGRDTAATIAIAKVIKRRIIKSNIIIHNAC